jgi:hypothetical protein
MLGDTKISGGITGYKYYAELFGMYIIAGAKGSSLAF